MSLCILYPSGNRDVTVEGTANTVARGMLEYQAGGLRRETGARFADLILEIFNIRWASVFGSFNCETRQDEPYFTNVWTRQRIAFDAAAQCYGMHELRGRFPHVGETVPQELLSWVLQLLKQASDDETPVRRWPAALMTSASWVTR
jgi:hypothetical protein